MSDTLLTLTGLVAFGAIPFALLSLLLSVII